MSTFAFFMNVLLILYVIMYAWISFDACNQLIRGDVRPSTRFYIILSPLACGTSLGILGSWDHIESNFEKIHALRLILICFLIAFTLFAITIARLRPYRVLIKAARR